MSDKDILKKLADIEKTLAKISKSTGNHNQTLYNNDQRLIHLEKIINYSGRKDLQCTHQSDKAKMSRGCPS